MKTFALLLLCWLAPLAALALAATPAVRAQDSGPLLDLLVKKGTITNQEAEDLRAAAADCWAAFDTWRCSAN